MCLFHAKQRLISVILTISLFLEPKEGCGMRQKSEVMTKGDGYMEADGSP